MKNIYFGFIYLLVLPLTAQQPEKPAQMPGFFTKLGAAPTIAKNLWNQVSVTSAGQILATYYSAQMLTVLGHELGHSLTATALTGKLAPIGLGGPSLKVSKSAIPIFPLPPIYVTGFLPLGETITKLPAVGLGRFLMSGAGPAAGIATCLALLKAPYIYEEYQKSKSIKQACQMGIKKPLELKDISPAIAAAAFLGLEGNIYNLIPFAGADGYKMLMAINASAQTINAAKFGMIGVYAALTIYLTKKFVDIYFEKQRNTTTKKTT